MKHTFVFSLFIACIHFVFAQQAITANDSAGCAPLTVIFQATNIPNASNVQSYSWTFGNGQSVTGPAATATHTYSAAGNYSVTVYLVYNNGALDTIFRPNFIDVYTKPTAAFTGTPTQICAGQQVCFTSQSQVGSGPINLYQWDFGDGTGLSGTQSNPCHTYNLTGQFPVSLVITDVNGCQSFLTQLNYVTVSNVPNANFTYSPTAICNFSTPVTFNWSGPPTATHSWNFGNGQTSTAASPTHTYTANGSYTVTHVVTQGGCSQTFNQTIQVGITPPNILITSGTPNICAGQQACLSWSPIAFHTISWSAPGASPTSSTSNSPCFTYNNAGTYTVTATMTDNNNGCSSNASLNINVSPIPTVNFSTPDTLFCKAPHTVNFTSSVTNGTTYSWNFGQGTASSSVANPTYTYTQTGSFTVSLTVTNAAGCSKTTTKNGYIKIQPPNADFSALPAPTGCVPLTVTFNDLSTSITGPIVAWEWDFGSATANPTTSTAQSPAVLYPNTGQFAVQLIITNNLGCKDTIKKNNYIRVGTKPTADFTVSSTNFCASQQVTFTNLSTPATAQCAWDFGDGGTSTVQNPNYTYTNVGPFTVTLIVNNNGCRDTMIKTNYVNVLPPVVKFSITPTQACTVPQTVTINNQSIYNLTSSTFDWDFGDGTTSNAVNPPPKTYTTPGTYNIVLNITDFQSGCSGSHTRQFSVLPVDANFLANNTQSCAPDSIYFFNLSTNATTTSWDFGDGGTSTQANPVYTYSTPGIYTVTLIASNSIGCKDTLVMPNYINMQGLPVNFTADTTKACAPAGLINFTDLTPQTVPISVWTWNFGDNSPVVTTTSPNVSHTYTTGGVYTVTLQVLDINGCNSEQVLTNYIQINQPVASFSSAYPVNCQNNPVPFTSTSTGSGLYYAWAYGDGTFSTISTPTPTHSYLNNGTYSVSLTVTDILGCTASVTLNNYINITTLQGDFYPNGNITASCPPLLTGFTPDPASPFVINQWFWDFGDGGTSILQNPTHTYTLAGPYSVSLIITSNGGCKDTIDKPNFIFIDGPIATYTISPLQTCPGIPVNFQPVNPQNVVQYEWNFGDTNFSTSGTTTHSYNSPGTYQPVLTIWDANQCKVVLPTTATIVVNTPPNAGFTVDSTYACVPVNVVFADQSTPGNSNLTTWSWNFGDGNNTSVSTSTAGHTYTTSGYMDVTMIVTDANGCKDTLKQDDLIYLTPNNTPPTPTLYGITVRNKDSIRLAFTPFDNAIGDFGYYRIERSDDGGASFQVVGIVANVTDTVFTDFQNLDTESQSYCYRVYTLNHCGTVSNVSETHCSVSLSTTSLQDAVQLDWTPYVGWNQVQQYRIWQVLGYFSGGTQLVDSVAGNVTTYTHDNLDCWKPYSYRIEAVKNAQWHSWSDSSSKVTQHYTALTGTDMGVATVVNDRSILLGWEIPAAVSKLQYVQISRKELSAQNYTQIALFSKPNLPNQFEDKLANVSKRYAYAIQAADSCGDITPIGRTGQNMVVQAGRSGQEIHVKWNPYREWEGGVHHYAVELLNKAGNTWLHIGTVDGTDSMYIDDRPRFAQDANCYRVRAFKNNNLQITSLSNSACSSTDAQIFIPNVFTPNGDGTNDFFEVKGNYIARYHILIVDRWGGKVFESNDIGFSWDGTKKGVQVPEGVFPYVIEIQGVSGNTSSYKGTVTVIR